MTHRRLPLPKPGTIITRAVLDRLGACRIPEWWDQLDPKGRGIKLTVAGGGHLFKIVHFAAHESHLQYGFDREPALDLGTDLDRAWSDVR